MAIYGYSYAHTYMIMLGHVYDHTLPYVAMHDRMFHIGTDMPTNAHTCSYMVMYGYVCPHMGSILPNIAVKGNIVMYDDLFSYMAMDVHAIFGHILTTYDRSYVANIWPNIAWTYLAM